MLGRQYHVDHFVCRPELKKKNKPTPSASTTGAAVSRDGRRRRRSRKRSSGSPEDEKNEEGNAESDDDDDGSGTWNVHTTSSGRRVRRRFAKLSYSSGSDDEEEEESGGDDPAAGCSGSGDPVQSGEKREANDRRGGPTGASASKKRLRRSSEESVDENGSDDNDDDESDNENDNSSSEKAAAESDSLSPDARKCPHCGKKFSVFHGLKYHVDKFVCRPEARPGGPVQKGRRRTGIPGGGGKYKKIRGSLPDRTCQKCRRVFTSALGLQYHMEKRVCVVSEAMARAKRHPFHRLEAGQEFATAHGVVRVVKDDRGPEPIGELPDDANKLARSVKNFRIKRAVRLALLYAKAAGSNLFRRRTLNRLYERGRLSAAAIKRVYDRRDGESADDFDAERFTVPEDGSNPEAPETSYPDRIVECELVKDDRERVTLDRNMKETGVVCQLAGILGARLFLRRRDLKEGYDKDDVTYACFRCGQVFSSKPGVVYHLRTNGCGEERVEASKESNRQRLRDIQLWAERLERISQPEVTLTARAVVKKKRQTKVTGMSVYPQVWLSLGFKLMPRSETTTKEGIVSAFKRESDKARNLEPQEVPSAGVAAVSPARKKAKVVGDPSMDPRVVLQRLRSQMRYEESRAIGPMYPGVYASLRFREFDPRRTAVAWEKERLDAKRKRLQEKKRDKKRSRVQAAQRQAEIAAAPAIDMQVLVGDLEAGRFPSYSRFQGQHDDRCCVCRDGDGELFGCDYCEQALHYSCLQRKWKTLRPEPFAGFLCHSCIGNIVSRRMRAEKRILGKGGVASRDPAAIASKVRLLAGTLDGREYECLEAQGQRLSEVTVLLKDAESRLTASLGAAELNTLHISMIGPSR